MYSDAVFYTPPTEIFLMPPVFKAFSLKYNPNTIDELFSDTKGTIGDPKFEWYTILYSFYLKELKKLKVKIEYMVIERDNSDRRRLHLHGIVTIPAKFNCYEMPLRKTLPQFQAYFKPLKQRQVWLAYCRGSKGYDKDGVKKPDNILAIKNVGFGLEPFTYCDFEAQKVICKEDLETLFKIFEMDNQRARDIQSLKEFALLDAWMAFKTANHIPMKP